MGVLRQVVCFSAAILLSSLVIAGCATNHINLIDQEKVDVQKVFSRNAYFFKLNVYSDDSKIILSGELHKRIPSRGRIYGHVDVEVVSPHDTVLYSTTSSYHRRSLKSFASVFTIDIPLELEDGSSIRVTHHCALRTLSEKNNNRNQDQNNTDIDANSRMLDKADLYQFT